MVKYIEFDRVETDYTVLEFKARNENAQVNYFTGDNIVANIVSVVGDAAEIDELVLAQPTEINCKEIVYDEFKTLVKDSRQIANINRQVKELIAKKYSIEDEIAMLKRAETDEKRLAYELYVSECKAFGDSLKEEIGY